MDLSQLSPSVAAALRTNPELAQLPRVFKRDLPHHTTQEAWDIAHLDPFADVPTTPPRPATLSAPQSPRGMHGEIKSTLIEYSKEQELADRCHVGASALWAESLNPIDAPDAVTHALTRIDEVEERHKRYRMATGLNREARMKRIRFGGGEVHKTYRMPKDLHDRIVNACNVRGDRFESDTIRFLVECGLILMDERARRYEIQMITELRDMDPARALTEIKVGRYVDQDRLGFKHTLLALDPLVGAPPSIRKELSA